MTIIANAIVDQGEADPNELLNHPANFRIHSADQQEAMEAILDDVGFVSEVLVNRRTGRILDGHMRAEIARRRKCLVPVRYVDIPEDQEAVYLASVDPMARLAKVQRGRFNAICNASFGNLKTLKVLQGSLPKIAKPKTKESHTLKPEPSLSAPSDGESLLSVLDDIPTDEVLPIGEAGGIADEAPKFISVSVGDVVLLVESQEFVTWEEWAKVAAQAKGITVEDLILESLGLSNVDQK